MTRNKLLIGLTVSALVCGVLLIFSLSLSSCSSSSTTSDSDSSDSGATALSLSSDDISSGSTIGSTYVTSDCGGSDQSPHLAWSGDLPSGTLSLAITILDQSSTPANFVHWIVYNIPTSTISVARNASAGMTLPTGATESTNDYGGNGYGGPCPPTGENHTYEFKLWALDVADLTTDSTIDFMTPSSILTGIDAHDLGSDSFTATFTGT